VKRIAYPNFGRGESFVDYEIFDGCICVFSGVTNGATSTVSVAERIVKIIANAEAKPLKFYDLQTQKGHDHYKPGECSFHLLVITNQANPEVIRWIPERLPPKVFEAFRDHIGPNPRVNR
jgi:hypothetical protein